MRHSSTRRPPLAARPVVLVVAAVLAMTAGACGSTARAAESQQRMPAPATGTVSVLYAGSLVTAMEQDIAPTFTARTGYRVSGYAGGSQELGHEIADGVRRADVLVSASPEVDDSLAQGERRWVSWYAAFAASPLVLGYNPHSRFASALRSRPWPEVVTAPGFLLGRTDPTLDPKGQLTVAALHEAARRTGDAALGDVAGDGRTVFPEQTLLGRLEAGQLDGAFLYATEAEAAGLPTVRLAPLSLGAHYTVTVLAGAPHAAAARAFVEFLLGGTGRRAMARAGLQAVEPPKFQGHVPAWLPTADGASGTPAGAGGAGVAGVAGVAGAAGAARRVGGVGAP